MDPVSQEGDQVPRAIEEPLNDAMDRILAQDGVKGVLVSDKEGLCVGVKGSIHPSNSARLTNIFEAALKMAPEQVIVTEDGQEHVIPEQPLVTIETNEGQVITAYMDGFCTTICKSYTSSGAVSP